MTTTPALGRVESAAAIRDTQREYESVTILRPETTKPEVGELIRRMQGVFAERGGSLIKIDSWGIRVLAYPVRRQRKGLYLYWKFLGGSDIVAEFERHMRLLDKIVRFYTVRIDDDVDPHARPSEVTDAIVDAVSDPGPDPDEVRRAAEEASRLQREREDTARREAEAAQQAAAAEQRQEDSQEEGA